MDWNVSPTIKALAYACIGAFVLQGIVGPQLVLLFGLVPAQVVRERWLWQTVTYAFLHGNLWHLLLNLFALWMFGRVVEASWGSGEFLKYCLICALGAAAATLAITPFSTHPVIGASGVVYGLLVAFALLYPDTTVYLYFLFPMKAKYVALLFGLLEFTASAFGSGSHVANLAHLGGMLTGYVYIRWWGLIRRKAVQAAGDAWERLSGSMERPGRGRRPRPPVEDPPQSLSAEVDRILDKILVQGVESLTPEEKETMKRFSKRQKHDA